MERLADPRIYVSALEQSVEPGEYQLDHAKFTYCPTVKQVITPATEKPFTSLTEFYAIQKQHKKQ